MPRQVEESIHAQGISTAQSERGIAYAASLTRHHVTNGNCGIVYAASLKRHHVSLPTGIVASATWHCLRGITLPKGIVASLTGHRVTKGDCGIAYTASRYMPLLTRHRETDCRGNIEASWRGVIACRQWQHKIPTLHHGETNTASQKMQYYSRVGRRDVRHLCHHSFHIITPIQRNWFDKLVNYLSPE